MNCNRCGGQREQTSGIPFKSVTPSASDSRGGEIMSRRILASCIQAALFIPFAAIHAEELPTVVVSATRSAQSVVSVPASIRVITRQEIENSAAANVGEILRANGVQINDLYGDGAETGITMRGLDSTANVLIIVDGRRLNNVDMSAPDLGGVSMQNLERIEIIQGSAGSLFGEQAVGGVINIITRRSQHEASASYAMGSYKRNRMQVKVADKLSDSLSFGLSADALMADNYRDNNQLNSKNILGRLDFNHSTGNVFVEYGLTDRNEELPGSLLAPEVAQNRTQSLPEFAQDYSSANVNVLRTGIKNTLGENWALEAEITSRDEDRDIQQSFRGWPITTPLSIDNNQREFTPRAIGSYTLNDGELLVTLGMDLIDTQYASEITNIRDDQSISALYAQVVVPVASDIDLTLGGRYSKVENDVVATYKTGTVDDSVSVGELGVSWQASDALRVFARVDQNFRFAKVDELTYTSPGVELKTQTGDSIEVGTQWISGQLSCSAVVYRLSLKDEIAFDSTAPEPAVSPFGPGANVNFDPTTHDGLMLDVRYQATAKLGVTSGFAYTDARFDSGVYADNYVAGVVPRVFTVSPDYQFNDNLMARFEWIYNDAYYVSGDNDNALAKKPSYTLANANISWREKTWSLTARINNLFDREYNEVASAYDGNYDGIPEQHALSPASDRNVWLTFSVNIE
jgi:iron complex outermembrane receptor protein